MKKYILIFIFVIFSFVLASCGFATDALTIESVTTQELENGDIQVVITYVDDVEAPFTFVVPKGQDGIDGKGIRDVEIDDINNEKPHTTKLVFKFEDDSLEDYFVYVPNGVGIEGVDTAYDEEQNLVLKLLYTNGDFSDDIIVKRGAPGKTAYEVAVENGYEGTEEEWLLSLRGLDGLDGLSLYDIQSEKVDDYHVKYTLYFTDLGRQELGYDEFGNPLFDASEITPIYTKELVVETKRGVSVVDAYGTYDETSYNYGLVIVLDDNTEIPVAFERVNTIITGLYAPQPNQGIPGDYYYSTTEMTMYLKDNEGWGFLYSLRRDSTYRVTFNLNANGDKSAILNSNSNYVIVEEGKYLAAKEIGYELPIPTRTGYTFNGWFLVANPSETSGRFTDTTPVYRDMTLYANWVKSTYQINFDLNAGEDTSASLNGADAFINIGIGKYIYAIEGVELPIPTRDGYTFSGWYLEANPTATSGMFTDTTPVYGDLVLYASWKEN